VGAFNWKSITTLIVLVSLAALLLSGENDRGFILYVLSICGLIFFALFFQMHFSRITLSEDVLIVGGGLYKARVALCQLDVTGASLLDGDEPSGLGWRLNGIGIPGYCQGWFSGPRKKKIFAIVTRRLQRVYVPTSAGFDLMLTPDDPHSFLEALKRLGVGTD
jgi:hypothetical protein